MPIGYPKQLKESALLCLKENEKVLGRNVNIQAKDRMGGAKIRLKIDKTISICVSVCGDKIETIRLVQKSRVQFIFA